MGPMGIEPMTNNSVLPGVFSPEIWRLPSYQNPLWGIFPRDLDKGPVILISHNEKPVHETEF